jgi:hypothetical protein
MALTPYIEDENIGLVLITLLHTDLRPIAYDRLNGEKGRVPILSNFTWLVRMLLSYRLQW